MVIPLFSGCALSGLHSQPLIRSALEKGLQFR
jgi:hypothetical protein